MGTPPLVLLYFLYLTAPNLLYPNNTTSSTIHLKAPIHLDSHLDRSKAKVFGFFVFMTVGSILTEGAWVGMSCDKLTIWVI